MDLGLYNLKYPFRRLIQGTLPLYRHVSPNAVSLMLLPVGAATAVVYYHGATAGSVWFLLGAGLVLLRMYLGTMDGLVAVHYGRSSAEGEMVNRITPELCDAMYLVALAMALPEWRSVGLLAVAAAWLVSFAGLVGLTGGRPVQSVGPVGQTDRLAALILFSVLASVGGSLGWGLDFILVFLWWVVVGSVLTVALRLQRNLRTPRVAQ